MTTGTIFIATVYNNETGAEFTALVNSTELPKLLAYGENVTVRTQAAETATAEEIVEKIKLRCQKG